MTTPTIGQEQVLEARNLIDEVDVALRMLSGIRRTISETEYSMGVIESQALSNASGSNESQRKADMTRILFQDKGYQQLRQNLLDLQERRADNERRFTVAKEKLRLLRSEISLITGETYAGSV